MTFDYVQPTPEQIEQMQKFRAEYATLYALVQALPDSRGKSLAMTKLEESNMWLNKALTHNS